jgi:hypothetical protein
VIGSGILQQKLPRLRDIPKDIQRDKICRKICRKVSLDASTQRYSDRYSDSPQDVALQKLPVRFILDRAGLVGADCMLPCLLEIHEAHQQSIGKAFVFTFLTCNL